MMDFRDHWRAVTVLAPAALDHATSVVVVGPSCVGKTTLVDRLRHANIPGVVVPDRFVTRPRRKGDHPAESRPLSVDELELPPRGKLGLWWTRPMEHGRVEHYAFARAPAGMLPIYSANNAILAGACPPEALAGAVIAGITAPDHDRQARMLVRSPDLATNRATEVAHRLAERTEDVAPQLHVLIDNRAELEAVAIAELIALVRWLARR